MVAHSARLGAIRFRTGTSQCGGKRTLASVIKRVDARDAKPPTFRAYGTPDHRSSRMISTSTLSSGRKRISRKDVQHPSDEQSSTTTTCKEKREDLLSTMEWMAAPSRSPSLRTGITTLTRGSSPPWIPNCVTVGFSEL